MQLSRIFLKIYIDKYILCRPHFLFHPCSFNWRCNFVKKKNASHFSFSIIDQKISSCRHFGGNRPKMRFGHKFWLGVLLTQGQRVWTAFFLIFSGIPHLTIFGTPKYRPVVLYLACLSVFGHIFERDKYGSWSQVFTGEEVIYFRP